MGPKGTTYESRKYNRKLLYSKKTTKKIRKRGGQTEMTKPSDSEKWKDFCSSSIRSQEEKG